VHAIQGVFTYFILLAIRVRWMLSGSACCRYHFPPARYS